MPGCHGSASAACAATAQILQSAHKHKAGLSAHEHAQIPWMTWNMRRGALQGHTLSNLLVGCLHQAHSRILLFRDLQGLQVALH